jgi:hypothetical protein
MLVKRVVIVIDGMLVNRAVGVPMHDDVAMSFVPGMPEDKAEIVMAGIAGGGF